MCNFQNKLIEYLDGALSGEEARTIQAHLAECRSCQEEGRALEAVLREARAPLPEPSELFWINFLPHVRERIAARPEPWFSLLFNPAVGWGSLSLATLIVLAGLLFWRMAPTWQAVSPGASQGDYLTYETGYTLNDHLAQLVENSKDKTSTKRDVFEKLSPKDGQDSQLQPGDSEDLDNLLEGLTPEQKKILDQKIKELEEKAKIKEA
jgi:Putative zinc-finger